MKKNTRLNDYYILPGVMFVTAVAYLPALKNYLVADSWVFVYQHSLAETFSYFYTSIIPLEWDALWFRPLPMFSFWLDGVIWPGTEWGPHLTNIVLHLCNIWIIWLLIRFVVSQANPSTQKKNTGLPAFAACLVYGLHPLNTGAVGWVAARFDIMSVTFGLAGMLVWLTWDAERKNMRSLYLSAFLLLCAILSKEQGIAFLFVCVLGSIYQMKTGKKDRGKHIRGVAILLITVLIYFLYRMIIFQGIGGYLSAEKVIRIGSVLGFFFAVLFPFLNVIQGWTFSLSFFAASGALLVLIIFFWKIPQKHNRNIQRIHVVSVCALFIAGLMTTAPHTGITFIDIMGHAESRFALIAITGLSLLIGCGIAYSVQTVRGYRAILGALFLLGILTIWRTDVQIQAWNDAGKTAHQIISTTLREAPDPPAGSRMLFFNIPRDNDQFAYIFGIGLKDAILRNYPDRTDITIIPTATGTDLKDADPKRDFVFGYNDSSGQLERMRPRE